MIVALTALVSLPLEAACSSIVGCTRFVARCSSFVRDARLAAMALSAYERLCRSPSRKRLDTHALPFRQ